jgi:hypothetical protein
MFQVNRTDQQTDPSISHAISVVPEPTNGSLLANADQCRGPCASKLLSVPHAIELSDSSPAQHLDAAMVLDHSVL